MQTEKTIGELIEYHVRKNKMSITDFADKINKTRENVYKIFQKNDLNIQLLNAISKVLNHNFFLDLANDDSLINVDADYKTIKMKDLSEWIINRIVTVINDIPNQNDIDNKKLKKWAKSFSKKDAEAYVWKNSLLELKQKGIEDEDYISEGASTMFAMEIVQEILNEWFIIKDFSVPSFGKDCMSPYIDKYNEMMGNIPEILKKEAIYNLEQELNQKPKSELCGQKIEIRIWVRPDCFPELLGIAKIEFDNDCRIIKFDFDTSECTL